MPKDAELVSGGFEISNLTLESVILTPINYCGKIYKLGFEHTDLEMPLRHFKVRQF